MLDLRGQQLQESRSSRHADSSGETAGIEGKKEKKGTHLQLGVLAAPHQALWEEEPRIAGPSEQELRNRSGPESSERWAKTLHMLFFHLWGERTED